MGKVCYSYFDFPRFRESRRSDFDEEERCKVGKPYCLYFGPVNMAGSTNSSENLVL